MSENMLPGGYTLSDDPALLQPEAIHAYLTRSYWCPGIGRALVDKAIAGSHCVGIYRDGAQVGFARVITDHATFAHLADVYVLEEHQGMGLAQAMMAYFDAHPDLQRLRRWNLNTRDAHTLYERFGWVRINDTIMQRHDPEASRELSA
jgi:GNAT superfamily N-acetyltransferase